MPVAMLKPGKGKTHRAYIWSYCTTSFDPIKAVVFDFAESRAREHARDFLDIDTEVSPAADGAARSSATTTRYTKPPSRTGSSKLAA